MPPEPVLRAAARAARRRYWGIGATLLLAVGAAGFVSWRPSAPGPVQPVAVWRDGRIEAIQHCEHPTEAETLLACASLHCQAAAAARVPNPTAIRIGIASRVPGSDASYLRFVGVIETEQAAPLPRGYECHVEGLTVTELRLIN